MATADFIDDDDTDIDDNVVYKSLKPIRLNSELTHELVSEIMTQPKMSLGKASLLPGGEIVDVTCIGSALLCRLSDLHKFKSSKSYHKKRELMKQVDFENNPDMTTDLPEVGFSGCVIIKWEDFVGCRLKDISRENEPQLTIEVTSFEVYCLEKKTNYKKRRRFLLRFTPIFNRDNLTEPLQDYLQREWVDKILLTGRRFTSCGTISDSDLISTMRVLVCVNPVSGTKKSLSIFHKIVAPSLRDAGVECELFITARVGHLREMLSKENLDKWEAIFIISGDGSIFEAINGLLSRADTDDVIRKPLGIIPGGTGNALAASMLFTKGEAYSPLNSTFLAVKGLFGAKRSLDLGKIVLQNGDKYYCFLGMCFGIIADLDIESESYRWLGQLRFNVGGLIRIVKRRAYMCRVSYIPKNSESDDWVNYENTNIVSFYPTLLPKISHNAIIAPNHQMGCGHISLTFISGEANKNNLVHCFTQFEEGSIEANQFYSCIKAKAYRMTPIQPNQAKMTIDGENIPQGEMSCEIVQNKISLLWLKNNY